MNKIRALRRASRCSDATISQIALDIRTARKAVEANKPRRGRKKRDYLADFNACFPDFPPAETYEKFFFRIAILSGLLGSDEKAYEYVAARHPTKKSSTGAGIEPKHLADARKNDLVAERKKSMGDLYGKVVFGVRKSFNGTAPWTDHYRFVSGWIVSAIVPPSR